MKSKLRMAVGLIILALLVTTVPFFGCAPEVKPPPPPVKETTLNIAFTGPYSGPWAAVAVQFKGGADDFVRYANESNYIPGVKFELFTGDTGYNPAKSLSLYERFKGKGLIWFATVTTTDAEPIRKFLEEDEILGICTSVSPQMVSPPGWWFDMGAPLYPDAFTGFCQWVIEEDWDYEAKGRAPRVANMGFDNPKGRGPSMAKEWIEENLKGKIEFPLDIIIPFNIADATAELTRVKEAKIDYLFFSGGIPECMVVLKNMAELGLRDKITFMADISIGGFFSIFRKIPLWRGTYQEALYAYIMADKPGTNLARECQKKYHPETFYEDSFYFMGFLPTWIGIEAVKRAVDEVGLEKLTSADVKRALESGQPFETGGILNPVVYGPDKRVNNYVCIYKTGPDGEPILVKEPFPLPPTQGIK